MVRWIKKAVKKEVVHTSVERAVPPSGAAWCKVRWMDTHHLTRGTESPGLAVCGTKYDYILAGRATGIACARCQRAMGVTP